MSISLPGYLELDLQRDISIEDEAVKSLRGGGTAKVVQGKLLNNAFIQRFGIVDIALKVFPQESASQDFIYEVAIMNAIPDSPYLCRLVGYYNKTFPAIIAMKYYPSTMTSLFEDPNYQKTSNIILKAAHDIANGLDLLHDNQIIHFDVKPGE